MLHNPDFARVAEAIGMRGIRVTDPHDVDAAVAEALAHPGPVLLDVLTNPDEIALPPKPTLEQGWGFAIAKMKEFARLARVSAPGGRCSAGRGHAWKNRSDHVCLPRRGPATPIPRSSGTSASSPTSTTASRRWPTGCCS